MSTGMCQRYTVIARSPTEEMSREASARSTHARMRGRASWKSASCATPSTTRHTRRRVEVLEHVDGVGSPDGEHGEDRERGPGDAPERAARESVDAAVGEVEAELLHEQPHEEEVQEPDRLDAGRETHHVDGDDRGEQRERCDHPGALVGAQHHRHERRDRDVDAEEPQRLADAEARGRHELGGHSSSSEGDEADRDDDTSAIAGRTSRSRRARTYSAGVAPRERIDRQWWKLEKPPAMKKSGMICTTQLTGPNQACSSSAFCSTGPATPTLTPHIIACSAKTATSSTMRIASTLESRATPVRSRTDAPGRADAAPSASRPASVSVMALLHPAAHPPTQAG